MTDKINFDGQSVIVTGAGGGLGRAYALELARRGASVLVNDPGVHTDGTGSSTAAADAVAEEIEARGGRAATSHTFAGSPEAADEIVDAAVTEFGRLDAVICNAGILLNAPFPEVTPEHFDAIVSTHLGGAFWVAQRAYRAMASAGGGRIVLVSSQSGVFGGQGHPVYAMAKAGILGLTRAIALEGRDYGIVANAILPVAMTRLAGVRSTPTPELAAAVDVIGGRLVIEHVTPLGVFLASDACTSNGQLYSAAAGRFARVVIGHNAGWLAPDKPVEVDELAAHWTEVADDEQVLQPRSAHEELLLIADQVSAQRAAQAAPTTRDGA